MRPVLPPEEIDRHAESFQRQAFTVLDPDRTEVRRNGEWLDMPTEELFRLARHATVAQLLARDDFSKRFDSHQPISVLELLYPLLQGYDSVAVRSDVELGGTDQTFNLLLGRDIQQAYGVPPQSILTMPILPGTDGVQRMSKSAGNYIGVTEPPEEIFGKVMSIPDAVMPTWYELLADEPFDPAALPVESKRRLARMLTARFHGEEAAAAAEAHFDRVHKDHQVPEDIPEAPLPDEDPVHLPALLRDHFGVSASEARRLLAGGGVRLDGEPLGAEELDVPRKRLEDAILQVGKRRFLRFQRAG
jgi:tyrosyl-tRNA synthetase